MVATARAIYEAIKADSTAVAAVRAEAGTLALEIATGDNAGIEITGATVNGQSYQGQVSMTKQERLKLLRLVIRMLDEGAAISSRGRARFGN